MLLYVNHMPYYDANTIKLVKQRKEMLGLIRTINQYADWTDDLMFPDIRPLTCPHLSVFPSCATSVLKNQLALKIMNFLSSVSILPLFYLIFYYKALLLDKKKRKEWKKNHLCFNAESQNLHGGLYCEPTGWETAVCDVDCCFFVGIWCPLIVMSLK